jgi:hypothetical protein
VLPGCSGFTAGFGAGFTACFGTERVIAVVAARPVVFTIVQYYYFNFMHVFNIYL